MPPSRKTKSKPNPKNNRSVRFGKADIAEYDALTPESLTKDSREYHDCPELSDEIDYPCMYRGMTFGTMDEMEEYNALMEYKSIEKRKEHYAGVRRKTPVSARRRKSKQVGGMPGGMAGGMAGSMAGGMAGSMPGGMAGGSIRSVLRRIRRRRSSARA